MQISRAGEFQNARSAGREFQIRVLPGDFQRTVTFVGEPLTLEL
jgi:hypothetical protein